MQLQVGVKVLLKNSTGQFLLLRRSSEKYREVSHKWDIPGGRIDLGKTLMENLEREVLEETGLKLKEEPRLIGAQDIILNEERHIVRLTYIGKADEGELRLSEEHTEYGWFNLSELNAFEDLDKYLKNLIEKIHISDTLGVPIYF